MRGQPQPLQLSGRQGRCTALKGQVAQAQFGQGADALQQVLGNTLCSQAFFHRQFHLVLPRRHRAQQFSQLCQRQLRQLTNVHPGKLHRQRSLVQALARARRAGAALHELRHALFHQRTLGVGEGMQDITPCAHERALVARLQLAFQRIAGLFRSKARIHRCSRCFFGEQDPVALLFRQVAPRNVYVITQGHQDVALVLALPRQRPGRHRALADGQRGVGHHQRFGHFIHTPQAMTLGAGALWQVGRKVLGIQHRLPRRVTASTGIQHADQARQGGNTAHRRARTRRAALLLQGHGGGKAFDGIHVRYADLINQPPRIRRHRLEIPPLRLGIHRGKRQGRLARTRHPSEHHQGIAGNVHIDVAQVMFAGATYPHETEVLGDIAL